jgi:vacuolar protein sorting-associated protein IST1
MPPASSLVVQAPSSLLPSIHLSIQTNTTFLPQNKLKVQLKLAISRLRMTQQKDTAIAKQQRRSMAQLLEEKKLESARIRVENIIRSDITTELHEILELYCELLIARSQLLDTGSTAGLSLKGSSKHADSGDVDIDPGLQEAVRSIIYAAPRTEIKELHQARALLIEKYGKDFALSAMDGEGVAERVLKKLRVDAPSQELVDKYLRLIAETYNVRFPGDPLPSEEDEEDEGDEDDDDEEGSGGQKVPALEAEDLVKATPPRDAVGVSSPIRIAPASPSTENVSNKLKLPDKASAPKAAKPRKQSTGDGKKAAKKDDGNGPGGSIPDLGDLAARFAALKKV